jgi:hypothetical protein
MQQESASGKVNLRACFKRNILFLDPSRFDLTKKEGSVRLYQSPLWRDGFTYKNIDSSGYVKLTDVNITIFQ